MSEKEDNLETLKTSLQILQDMIDDGIVVHKLQGLRTSRKPIEDAPDPNGARRFHPSSYIHFELSGTIELAKESS